MNLPEICKQWNIIVDDNDNVPVTSSLAVGDKFGKRHAHVVRDIDALISINPDLGSSHWFRKKFYTDNGGRRRPYYQMPSDGFMLLVMGYTGADFLAIKIAYINAFNAMKKALAEVGISSPAFLSELRELLNGLRVSLAGNDAAGTALKRIESKLDTVGDKVADIRRHQTERTRLRFGKKDEQLLILVVSKRFNGCCPISGEPILYDDDTRIPGASEIHHFNGPNSRNVEDAILIAKKVHDDITHGRVSNQTYYPDFVAFQRKLAEEQKNNIIDFPSPQYRLF